jgi:hypothetical protein
VDAPTRDARLAPRSPRTIWLALAAAVMLAAVGAAVYIIDAPDVASRSRSGVVKTVP